MPEEENWPDNDHDLLLLVARDTCWIKKGFENHLQEHKDQLRRLWTLTVCAIGALLTTIGLLIVQAIL